MQLRNILFATDFSESAELGQAAAFELADRFSSKLHVFHALEVPLPIFEPYTVAVPEAFISEARKGATEKLGAIVDAARVRGIEGTSALGAVPAPFDISEQARKVDADLVVIGSEGHTGIKHFLLGSVAEGTVKGAPCSVLAVRGSLAPPITTLVVGIDFFPEAQSALDAACELADQLGANLHLVHAAKTTPPLIGREEIAVPTAFYDSVMREAERRISEAAAACRIKGTVSTEVSTAPAQVALSEVAERLDAELIIIGSHGRTGIKHLLLGSVAERTVRHAPCSVLTFRTKQP